MSLKPGVLIVLERDDAKTFFGQREDAPRLKYLEDLLSRSGVVWTSLNGNWQATHDALCGIEVDESFLDQCLLGGRPLHQGDDYHVVLVRPDVVAFIAGQLSQIDESKLVPEVVQDVKAVSETYRTAAERRAAVVFAAER